MGFPEIMLTVLCCYRCIMFDVAAVSSDSHSSDMYSCQRNPVAGHIVLHAVAAPRGGNGGPGPHFWTGLPIDHLSYGPTHLALQFVLL